MWGILAKENYNAVLLVRSANDVTVSITVACLSLLRLHSPTTVMLLYLAPAASQRLRTPET